MWLVDKSALVRIPQTHEVTVLSDRIALGLVRISVITRLEVGNSARSGVELRDRSTSPPIVLMPIEHLTPLVETRAIDVQQQFADVGHHRAPSIPDLLIAATAALAGLTLLR